MLDRTMARIVYLQALDEPKRGTLTRLHETILDILPDADQRIA